MSIIKPTFRIFDYDKAVEFYINWLGFKIDWMHEAEASVTPKFIQISLRDITLYLSEHHGDASPGSHVCIDDFDDLRAYNQLLNDKKYKYGRPGLEVPEWNKNSIMMTVHDPFGNRLTFSEDLKK
jgi:catechol 2,3-dioxygenase-like lactoylglutathione lyase family enzyme